MSFNTFERFPLDFFLFLFLTHSNLFFSFQTLTHPQFLTPNFLFLFFFLLSLCLFVSSFVNFTFTLFYLITLSFLNTVHTLFPSSLLHLSPLMSTSLLPRPHPLFIYCSLSPPLSCMIWAPRPTHSPALRAAWPPTAAVSTWAIHPAATGVAVMASGAPSAASVCRDTQDTSVKRVS